MKSRQAESMAITVQIAELGAIFVRSAHHIPAHSNRRNFAWYVATELPAIIIMHWHAKVAKVSHGSSSSKFVPTRLPDVVLGIKSKLILRSFLYCTLDCFGSLDTQYCTVVWSSSKCWYEGCSGSWLHGFYRLLQTKYYKKRCLSVQVWRKLRHWHVYATKVPGMSTTKMSYHWHATRMWVPWKLFLLVSVEVVYCCVVDPCLVSFSGRTEPLSLIKPVSRMWVSVNC